MPDGRMDGDKNEDTKPCPHLSEELIPEAITANGCSDECLFVRESGMHGFADILGAFSNIPLDGLRTLHHPTAHGAEGISGGVTDAVGASSRPFQDGFRVGHLS